MGRISWHIDIVPNTAHSLGSMVAAEKCKRLKEKVQGLFIEAQQYKGFTQKQTRSLKKKKSLFSAGIF